MHINPKLAFHTQDQTHSHESKVFAVACMDFRLVDDTTYFMNSLGFNNNYDQFVLAGASLGFSQDTYPHWGQTLIDHMSIGQSLHHFKYFTYEKGKSSLSTTRTVEPTKSSTPTLPPRPSLSTTRSTCSSRTTGLAQSSLISSSEDF
jgi:hypothetical protein